MGVVGKRFKKKVHNAARKHKTSSRTIDDLYNCVYYDDDFETCFSEGIEEIFEGLYSTNVDVYCEAVDLYLDHFATCVQQTCEGATCDDFRKFFFAIENPDSGDDDNNDDDGNYYGPYLIEECNATLDSGCAIIEGTVPTNGPTKSPTVFPTASPVVSPVVFPTPSPTAGGNGDGSDGGFEIVVSPLLIILLAAIALVLALIALVACCCFKKNAAKSTEEEDEKKQKIEVKAVNLL